MISPAPLPSGVLEAISADRARADVETLAGFGTRHVLSAPRGFYGRGIEAARAWLVSELERLRPLAGGRLTVRTQRFRAPKSSSLPGPTELRNVYALLAGVDPTQARRTYVVVAHYDSRNGDLLDADGDAPGANDDASGVAVCLACARALAREPLPASVAFLLASGEEQGRLGSRYFARWARRSGWRIEGVLSNDVVGGDREPGGSSQQSVRVFSEGVPAAASREEVRRLRAVGAEGDSPSRHLARYVAEIGESLLPSGLACRLVARPDRYRRGGDHLSFNEEGFAAVRFTEERENFRHQHQTLGREGDCQLGDLPAFVDPAYVAAVARLNAAALLSLASSPPAPENVRLVTETLENDSTLVWDEPPESPAAGYEVLWRETDAFRWSGSAAVGKVFRATVPVSKDNVLFAVRAVDAEGRRSPTVPPRA